jgi:hypothetical protein
VCVRARARACVRAYICNIESTELFFRLDPTEIDISEWLHMRRLTLTGLSQWDLNNKTPLRGGRGFNFNHPAPNYEM